MQMFNIYGQSMSVSFYTLALAARKNLSLSWKREYVVQEKGLPVCDYTTSEYI